MITIQTTVIYSKSGDIFILPKYWTDWNFGMIMGLDGESGSPKILGLFSGDPEYM